jgi:gliding motility associated protien GldN
MKVKLFFVALLFSAPAFAQVGNYNNSTKPQADDKPIDGYYKKENILNARVTPYAHLREADVMYAKRVWREIDLRDKMNRAYASPKARLIDVVMTAVSAGELTAYDPASTAENPDGDDVSKAKVLAPGQAMGKFADSTLTKKYDANGEVIPGSEKMEAGTFNADSIVKWRIKEDWIFDKQRSIFEPRIVAIAPLVKIQKEGFVSEDYQPAFWIYFPEARHIFATKEVINRNNDATGLSYDDIFMKRIFASYITKESNSDNLRIKDYAKGIDRLFESERVKKELMDYEHDLWHY